MVPFMPSIFSYLFVCVNPSFIRAIFSLLRHLRSLLHFVNYWLHFLSKAHLSGLPFLIVRVAIGFEDCQ